MTLTPHHRKYLPPLKDFPTEYIYEAWRAPRAVQERQAAWWARTTPSPPHTTPCGAQGSEQEELREHEGSPHLGR